MATATRSKRTGGQSAPPKFRHAVDLYAADVAASRIVAGPWVREACRRHQADRARRDITFDQVAADHAIGFFPRFLRFAEGQFAGEPFLLQPWQGFIVGSLFGWVGADGFRRFRHAYIETGKGNGKTPLLAGIGLYMLIYDEEESAEIYTAAVTRDQANIMFSDAVKMAEASLLARRLTIHARNIADLSTRSFMRPISSEGRSLDGKRVHAALLDEIHEHPTPVVVDKMRKGTKSRRQPMILEITNSGFDRASVCWEHHEYSIKVARGLVEDDTWFGYVCSLDEGEDPFASEACWPKANPNLDVSLPRKYLRGEVERSRGMPSEIGITSRLNFCIWTQQRTPVIPMDRWMGITDRVPDDALRGAPCWGGLDLGQSDDFSAGILIWRLEDGRVAVRARFWIPETTIAKRPDRPYDAWQRGGYLTVTPGEVVDYGQVEQEFREWVWDAGARAVGYDKRFAEQMAQNLTGSGIDMVDTGQGFQLNEALRTLLDLVTTGMLLHEGNPILAWMADNLVVRHGQRGEVRPDKPAAKEKIDGVVALAMAIDQMIRNTATAAADRRVANGEHALMML